MQQRKETIQQNSQFRFLSTGLICTYLSDQDLIGVEENWWKLISPPTLSLELLHKYKNAL